MKKNYILIVAIIFVISSISAQNKKDINKYTSKKSQYGFIENKGQIYDQNYKANPDVKYLLCLDNGMNVQLKSNSFSYDTYTTEIKEKSKDSLTEKFRFDKEESEKEIIYHFHRVDVELPGSNTNPEIIAEDALSDYMNFYNAVTPESGATNVRNYKKIIYKNIYPGIDMVFIAETGKAKSVEYTFVVNPGADAKLIQLHYIGANETQLIGNTIKVKVAQGNFTEKIPASWIKETNKKIEITYKNIDKDKYAFNIPSYSETHTLIIDPNPNLDWGTYYGASNLDVGNGIVCDDSGYVYITGLIGSSISMATSGAHQTTYGGYHSDAFVLKCNSIGVRQWSTYYGGNGDDEGNGITCDNSGNIFATGQTTSSNAIATVGAHKASNSLGSNDAFIVKFNNNGIRLWGTYYGGNSYDNANAISCDSSGNVIITGYATSSSNIATTGAYQTIYAGNGDIFVAKFNNNGVLQWGTYYGGNYEDVGSGITCDNNGNIFIAGHTTSSNGIATQGAFTTIYDGQGYNNQFNGFVSKFSAAGLLQWGTYVGGYMGFVNGVACDSNSNVFITGETRSSTGIATAGAHQTTFGGSTDAFIVKFSTNGLRQWGTYFGTGNYPFNGGADERGNAIACDLNGNIYITGQTSSTDSIATAGAYQTTHGGGTYGSYDAFIEKFDNNGVRKWGSYYGGSDKDYGNGIAYDGNGNVYITGNTYSTNAIATTGAFQTTYAGDYDVFVAKFSSCDSLPSNAGIINGITVVCQGQNSLTYSVPAIANTTSYIWSLPSGATNTSSTNTISVNYGSSAVSGNITVNGHNGCGDGGSSSLAISVIPLPAAAASITGLSSVCPGSSVTYSIPAIANALSYLWTLPTGATGISTTNTIIVNYDSSALSGNISVCGVNSCGNGVSSIMAITVSIPVVAAGSITGSTTVCQGQNTVTYSILAIANATSYIWTFPSGATGSSTTNTITVDYGTSAVSGDITVKGSNSCGDGISSSIPIIVQPIPATPVITQTGNALSSNISTGNQWYNLTSGLIINATSQTYNPVLIGSYFTIVTQNGCNSDSSNIIFYDNTGINEKNLYSDGFNIYPNPAKNNLIIELTASNISQNTRISIHNIQGQLLLQQNITQPQSEIDIHSLAKGIYIVKVNNDKECLQSKFVKE